MRIVYTLLAAAAMLFMPQATVGQNVNGTANGHDYVDMGLSVMWATTNLGATFPTGYGDFYAWGEISPAPGDDFNPANCKANSLNIIALDSSLDAAAKQWGGSWRMPTKAEIEELIANTTITENKVDGVRIFVLKSKINGNELSLPAAGGRGGTSALYQNDDGFYWCTAGENDGKASCLTIEGKSLKANTLKNLRYFGQSIRPVFNKAKVSITTDPATANKIIDVDGVSFTMVHVNGGTFKMGSKKGEKDEKPVHGVTLSDYMIGETEVTQALWKAVMDGKNPSKFQGDNLPVTNVSWEDCQKFIARLNLLTGLEFHLPSEAQWEFAARGGSNSRSYQYSGSDNIGTVAWYDMNSGKKPHPVKSKAYNELGLFDMSGNVVEWCADWSDTYPSGFRVNPTGPAIGANRIARGGGHCYSATSCRPTYRHTISPVNNSDILGLRLALD